MTRIFCSAIALVFFGLTLSCHAVAESSITYIAGLNAGVRDAEFELDGTALPGLLGSKGDVDIDWSETLFTVGFIGGLTYEDLSVTAILELMPQEQGTDVDSTIVGGAVSVDESRSSDIDRVDFTLTVSYEVVPSWQFFTGYKFTDFELSAKENSFVLGERTQEYREEGLFFGTGYYLTFSEIGTLSFTVAYATLDAEFSEDDVATGPDPDSPFPFVFGEYEFSGSATGLSYGLQWTAPLTDHWAYNVAMKYQSFETDDNSVILPFYINSSPSPDPMFSLQDDISVEHTDTIFNVGLFYVF